MAKVQANAAAIERKARPIYDSLNRGDFKGSIKQCNQALGKHPNNNLFSALKALAHDRLGNAGDAIALVEGIIASGTADDEVLHHCSNLLRGLGEYDVLLQLYQSASAAQPQDLGLLQELFLAHVRLGNVLEQQQLAMKISKAGPGELQTFWVVCSMLTQADRARSGAGAGMSQEMLLKLAAGVISKHLQREEVVSCEGVLVYLDILQAQGNFEACTDLLEGPCARAVQIPHELLRLKAQTALVSKEQEKAKALVMESLQSLNPDDWAGYMLLFSCCLPSTALPFDQAAEGLISVHGGFGGLEALLKDSEHWNSMQPGAEATESSYKQASSELEAFLSSIVSKVEAGEYDSMQTGLLRGPYLAQVDLAWRRYRLRLDAPSVLASAMLAYFKRFRRKPVVPQDLRKYAVALPRESAVWLAAALADERRSMSSEANASGGWKMERIQITASCLRLERHLGHPVCTSASDAADNAHSCMQLFVQWSPSMAACDERETLVGEQAAEHAVISCMAAFRLSGKISYLVQAVVQLTLAVKQRPFSAVLRLSLAGLQWLLGNADAALAEFHALSVRQVQLDSLSHHVLPAITQCGTVNHERYLTSVRRVRSDCEGAIVEAITECYTNGTYTKVPEFLGFRRREASSRTFLEADCEHGLLMMRQALIEGLSMTTKVQQAADGIVQRVAGIVSDDIECFRRDSAHESAVNEDLSQLPQWLPPLSCTSVHGALEWWQAAGRGSPSADAEVTVPWWTLPRASTSDTHEAHAWRESRACAVGFRSAQLILMGSLFLRSKANAKPMIPDAAPLTVDSVEEQLLAVSEAAGVSGVAMNEWHACQDWSVARTYLHGTVDRASLSEATVGEAKKPFVPSLLLQNLTVSILAWGVDLHVLALNAYGVKLGTAGSEGANSKCAKGDKQEKSDGQNDLEGSKASVNVACQHAKQSVMIIGDLLATLALNVQGGLQFDASEAVQPEGDGSAQFRHGIGSMKQGGNTAAEAAVAATSALSDSVKKVCTDLAKSVRECRLVCSHACAPALGVSQRTRRILEMMSDEKQTVEAFQNIATHQRGLLTDAADRLERWASMCGAVTRTLATQV